MPNWCDNSFYMTGPKEKINALWSKIEEAQKSDGNFGLLEAMVPIGEWDYGTAVSEWGTKWDVSVDDLEMYDDEDGTASISGNFQSAWGPPLEAYETFIDMNEDVTIEASYFEPGMDFGGYFRNGENIHFDEISEEIKEDKDTWDTDFAEFVEEYGIEDWYLDEDEEIELE